MIIGYSSGHGHGGDGWRLGKDNGDFAGDGGG
jgi:hypothetical protein